MRNKSPPLAASTERDLLNFQGYPKVIFISLSLVILGFSPEKMPKAKHAKDLPLYREKGNEAEEIQIVVINIQFILFLRQTGSSNRGKI